jgi:hypothetical protein
VGNGIKGFGYISIASYRSHHYFDSVFAPRLVDRQSAVAYARV